MGLTAFGLVAVVVVAPLGVAVPLRVSTCLLGSVLSVVGGRSSLLLLLSTISIESRLRRLLIVPRHHLLLRLLIWVLLLLNEWCLVAHVLIIKLSIELLLHVLLLAHLLVIWVELGCRVVRVLWRKWLLLVLCAAWIERTGGSIHHLWWNCYLCLWRRLE